MALFRGIQEYIALNANNITLVFDSGNIVNISGNIFLYPPQGPPILYNYFTIYLEYAICYTSSPQHTQTRTETYAISSGTIALNYHIISTSLSLTLNTRTA